MCNKCLALVRELEREKEFLITFRTSFFKHDQTSAYIFKAAYKSDVREDFFEREKVGKATWGESFIMELISIDEIKERTSTMISV